MKEEIVNRILAKIPEIPQIYQEQVRTAMYIVLNEYDISQKVTEVAVIDGNRDKAVKMFFVSKKVEGRTDKTLTYYRVVLQRFLQYCMKPLDEITTDDIRYYLARRMMQDKLSKVSQDNELRVLKSFFKWCAGERYISSIPTININAIKKEKRIKKPFSEMEIEKMRQGCRNNRDLAMIDVLMSTGVRISELVAMDINDIDGDELAVYGKGEKERYVYLNAKARLSIENYLSSRNDKETALFVSLKKPYRRLDAGGAESSIRNLGKKVGIDNVHPHRFRRTCATLALNRGMPIEQVQQMLGHEDIQTTTIYARSERENVKSSHHKYVT